MLKQITSLVIILKLSVMEYGWLIFFVLCYFQNGYTAIGWIGLILLNGRYKNIRRIFFFRSICIHHCLYSNILHPQHPSRYGITNHQRNLESSFPDVASFFEMLIRAVITSHLTTHSHSLRACFISSPADTPIVTLKMGSSLNPDDIKEGDDIYFDCHIQSNPKPYKLAWYHNVSI